MAIAEVLLTNFRHFSSWQASFDRRYNVMVGDNGTGKTSVLESLHYLAYGKSFRAQHPRQLRQHQAEYYRVQARLETQDQVTTLQSTYQNSSGIQRSLDGQIPATANEIAQLLPTVFIDTGTHRDLAHTPRYRRDFFNWCCFYTQNDYNTSMQRYQRIHSQRNHYLKQAKHLGNAGLAAWNAPYVYYAEQIHQARLKMCALLQECVAEIWQILAPRWPEVQIKYSPGWPQESSLDELLQNSLAQDLALGYSQYGPHRADLKFSTTAASNIFHYFSQGQQKLYSYALKLAQLLLLKQLTSAQTGILLIDDLPAELDEHSRNAILAYIDTLDCQCFITGLSEQDFPNLSSDQIHRLPPRRFT